MSNENVQIKQAVPFKNANLVEKICCFAWFFTQLGAMVFFLIGLCNLNGKAISAVTFLNNIVDIFSLQWSMFYYYVSSCAQGILYLVVLICMIKNLIQAITYWTNAEHRKAGMEEMCKNTFKLIIRYVLLSFAINQVSLTSYAIPAFVLMAIVFVALEGVKVLSSNRMPSILYLVSRFAYAAIVCVLVVFLGQLLCRTSFETLWGGLSLIFGYLKDAPGEVIIQTIYTYIVKEVFYLILLFVFFAILNELTYSKTVLGINEWKALLSVAATFVCIDLIVYFTFVGEFGNNVLESIFEQLKTQGEILSIVFFSIAGVLTGAYPVAKRYAQPKAVAVPASEEDEDGNEEVVVVPAPAATSAPVAQPVAQAEIAPTQAVEQPANVAPAEAPAVVTTPAEDPATEEIPAPTTDKAE